MKQKLSHKLTFTFGATALALLVGVASQSSVQADSWQPKQRSVTNVSAYLTDLDLDNEDALDGARARVNIVSTKSGDGTVATKVQLSVRGVQADRGTVFGAHVHTGPCVEGDGAAAGPHFNITTYNGEPTVVSPETEVWLDFTVNKRGSGNSFSSVDFALPNCAAQSIVIHEMGTDPSGGAGARLGCISL